MRAEAVTYVAVGVILLLWGVLVRRASRRADAVLALLPVVAWLGVLAWFACSGTFGSPPGDALPAYLLIGLLAFLVGSNFGARTVGSRRGHAEQ